MELTETSVSARYIFKKQLGPQRLLRHRERDIGETLAARTIAVRTRGVLVSSLAIARRTRSCAGRTAQIKPMRYA